jgi:5-methyltetrahydropteroyltriglutamate--homocysteine methyltransferase
LPSPSVNHFFSGDKSLAGSPYRDRHAFFVDVVAIYRQEIAHLTAAGCRYLQIDEVPIAVLCDPRNREIVRTRGEDPAELITDYCQAINDAIAEKPADMTICVHLCRGNGGHGQARGGYDPVAQRLFQELRVDGYFLEYDTERSGSFEALRVVPKSKKVVLGIISTKLRELEDADYVKRRIDDAARFWHSCASVRNAGSHRASKPIASPSTTRSASSPISSASRETCGATFKLRI